MANGIWFCETCDRVVDADAAKESVLRAHEGHDLAHFSKEDWHRALREYLPKIKEPRSNIDRLKRECERLLELLNDPHPGLLTWVETVQKHRKNIAELPDDEVTLR